MTPTSPDRTKPSGSILSRSKQENHPNVGEQKQSSSSTKKHGVTKVTDSNANNLVGVAKMTTTAPDNNRNDENRRPTHSNILFEEGVDDAVSKAIARVASCPTWEEFAASSELSKSKKRTAQVRATAAAFEVEMARSQQEREKTKNLVKSIEKIVKNMEGFMKTFDELKIENEHLKTELGNVKVKRDEVVRKYEDENRTLKATNETLTMELNSVKAKHENELKELKEHIFKAFES